MLRILFICLLIKQIGDYKRERINFFLGHVSRLISSTTYMPFLSSHLVVGPTCHSFPLLSLTTHQGPLVSSTFPSQRDRPCLFYSSRSSFAASLAPLARNRRRHLAFTRRAVSSPHSDGRRVRPAPQSRRLFFLHRDVSKSTATRGH